MRKIIFILSAAFLGWGAAGLELELEPLRLVPQPASCPTWKISLSIPPAEAKAAGVRLQWGAQEKRAVWVVTNRWLPPELGPFREAEFSGKVTVVKGPLNFKLALLLRDRTGKRFPIPGTISGKEEADGTRVLRFRAAFPEKGEQPEWPVVFHGFSMTFPERHGSGALELRTINIRLDGMPTVRFEAGNHYRLLLKESETPKFVLHSDADRALRLEGTVEVEDAYGVRQSYPIQTELNCGDTILTLPGDYSKNGIWYGKYVFRFPEQREGALSGTFRFGRMIPAGPTPGDPEGFIFAVHAHPGSYSRYDVIRMAELAALAGFKACRTDTLWHIFELEPGKIDFTLPDWWTEAFGKQHIKMFWLQHNCPPWAVAPDTRSVYRGRPLNRPDYDAFQSFIRRWTERYKRNIAFFESWNEPDLSFANFSVDEYLTLQHKFQEAVKSIAPSIRVTTGGFAYTWPDLVGLKPRIISRSLKEGRGDFDILSFHGHGKFKLYAEMIGYLKEIGATVPGKWIAGETGMPAQSIGELAQAQIMFTKVIYTMAEQALGYVWYNLREKGYHRSALEMSFGLVKSDLTPKAVYIAFAALIRNFRDARLETAFAPGDGVYVYGFRRNSGELLLPGWSEHEAEQLLLIFGIDGEVEKIDLFGNAIPLPCDSGRMLWKIGQNPDMLTFHNQKRELQIVSLAEPENEVSLAPGGTATLKLKLANPSSAAERFMLHYRGSTPELALSGPREMTIPPGRNRTISVSLRGGSAFRSVHPAEAKIECEIKVGAMRETMSIPVRAAWLMPYDSYSREPVIRLNRQEQVYQQVPFGGEFIDMVWRGPEDLSAEVYLKYNNRAFLVKIIVRDDVHSQPYPAPNGANGDSVQLAFGLPDRKGHWEFCLVRRDNGTSEAAGILALAGINPAVAARQLKLRTSRDETAKQTVYEVEIPWRAVGIDRPERLKHFRMSLIVNDCDDGKTRENSILVSDGVMGNKEVKRIDAFPVVELMPRR